MKIGIITLHKVVNYGSALQAYALQHYLESNFKADVEIVDYKYPNAYHKVKESLKNKVVFGVSRMVEYMFRHRGRELNLFKRFYDKYFNLSETYYTSVKQVKDNVPQYDVYMTGSDQVWNVDTLKNDPVMYCAYAPEGKKKVSFSASFTLNEIPQEDEIIIADYLSSYSHIGVREKSSLQILEKLKLEDRIVKECTCDPTLLLPSNEYDIVAADSTIKIKGEYVLAYFLCYAYNPEPAFSNALALIQKQYGCKVIVIGRNSFIYDGQYQKINGLGPSEFVYLFKNAKAIVTSSFHGTMFSIIYRKPFYAIVPARGGKDSRISDVLNTIGLSDLIVYSDEVDLQELPSNPYTGVIELKLNEYITKSKDFLEKALSNDRS